MRELMVWLFYFVHAGLLIGLLSYLGLLHDYEKSSKAVQVSLQQLSSVGNWGILIFIGYFKNCFITKCMKPETFVELPTSFEQ